MECKNPIICKKHGILVSVTDHANNIYRFLLAENPYDEDPMRDWFRICSGITKVNYTEGLNDNAWLVCGAAADYDDAKSKYLEDLLLQLTWFTYIWGGFESLIDGLSFQECPKQRGKINKVGFYLQDNYESKFKLPEHYNNLVTLLANYLKLTPSFLEADKNLFTPSQCAGKSGTGLTLVYKIRNGFAHGAFAFGEPDEYEHTKSYHTRIIHISCRIILLTIQMLLLAIHKEDDIQIEPNWNFKEDERIISATDFLQNLHLRDYKS
ncbi:hypothetical protein [Pedobacter psychroterrae]|uniref:Uncharacterized protein n=1 Tax=Pedobacter psychroterrae TaxID=2530453 RepID=A0A4R0NQ82_9SPHI|nr:hypothetical protein [Pedobacter psychroterrae]TCD01224.1 hypothetical protein EZ437_10735 [Pedobacter psychroterrae]